MERVAFLIEPEDVRISCLLNPETVVVRRNTGITARKSIGGHLTGMGMGDSPLMFTGGGETSIELELLFDVNIPGTALATHDVRHLSGLFFKMAENSVEENGLERPPRVRLVWGKSWNIPGVITQVAERLDCFSGSGIPSRSWLKLNMRRVEEEATESPSLFDWLNDPHAARAIMELLEQTAGAGTAEDTWLLDEGSTWVLFNERLDLLALRFFGNSSLWRMIAVFNGILDPLNHVTNQPIRIPPLSELVNKA